MKKEIHPEYGKTTFRCACGNVMETSSTLRKDVQIDVCSSCHPFYTGQQKIMDTTGRIDRFKKKFGSKIALGGTKKPKAKKPAEPVQPETQEGQPAPAEGSAQ